jgi:hypothetical protein
MEEQSRRNEITAETKAMYQKLLEDIISLRERVKQRLSHKSSIVKSMSTSIENITKKLDSDLSFFETELRGIGEFETQKGISPGTEVALRPPGELDIILGKVLSYNAENGQYSIADVDDSKRYTITESLIYPLDMAETQKKLMKGEIVYAIYPDTTSFYPATVVQASRRSAMNAEPVVIVQFHGDADESGINYVSICYRKHLLISHSML